MQIAGLEQQTGVSRHTLRFYEKQGLLSGVIRRENNYRDYPESVVEQVRLIQRLKNLDFSLAEIKDVLQGIQQQDIRCAEGAQLMAQKRREVAARMAELRALSKQLLSYQRMLEERARSHGSVKASGPK